MYNDNGIYKWKYQTTKEKEDVYTAIINKINIVEPKQFVEMTPEIQENYLNKIVGAIREINIFPIYYFNENGIKKAIQSVRDKKIAFNENDKLETQSSQGLLLLDFLFPNLHLANAGSTNENCIYNRFYDDEKLKKIIAAYLKYHSFSNLRTPFFTYGRLLWNTAINFMPMRAKAIYERFCPKNGVIYDYSCGYGGRMLGALSSKNNYTYYGVDPNTNTYYNLLKLGKYIQDTFNEIEPRYHIFNTVSEEFYNPDIKADFIFSCPPFFALERYSDEPTQSVNKFPQYELWLKHYARETIKQCRKMIKDTGLFGIDIIDFTYKNKRFHLVHDWTQIIQEEGFEFLNKYPIISRARKINKEDNTEFIYLFRPSNDINSIHFFGEQVEKNIPNAIAIYDSMGNLLNTCTKISEVVSLYPECNDSSLRAALKSGKAYKNKIFKYYKIDQEAPTMIDTPYICEIDGNYFLKQVDVAEYCGVTRQAVSAAKQKKSSTLNGKQVNWKK